MREKQLYQKFKPLWKTFQQRIEIKGNGGLPDVLLVNEIDEKIFVELKVIDCPKRLTTKIRVPLRQQQLLWMLKYPSAAFILTGINYEGNSPLFWLVPKKFAKIVHDGVSDGEMKSYGIVCDNLNLIVKYLQEYLEVSHV